jgi:hypothetical protein
LKAARFGVVYSLGPRVAEPRAHGSLVARRARNEGLVSIKYHVSHSISPIVSARCRDNDGSPGAEIREVTESANNVYVQQ